MDTDDEEEDEMPASRRNTITFPSFSPAPARQPSPLMPTSATEGAETTQPLRIVKALPSMNRLASPLSAMTIFESSPTPTSSLYPDLSTLPLPSRHLERGSRQLFHPPLHHLTAVLSCCRIVLAEMNARLTAAGRSATSGSLATLSSMAMERGRIWPPRHRRRACRRAVRAGTRSDTSGSSTRWIRSSITTPLDGWVRVS